MSPKLRFFLFQWANNTIGVVVATFLVRGIDYHNKPLALVTAAFLLGILNTFVRPGLRLLSLPLLIFTLGIFNFFINGLLLYFVAWLMRPYFEVEGFHSAFWGAFVITIVAFFLNQLTGTSNSRIRFQRGAPPPPRNPPGDGGNGPVIDV